MNKDMHEATATCLCQHDDCTPIPSTTQSTKITHLRGIHHVHDVRKRMGDGSVPYPTPVLVNGGRKRMLNLHVFPTWNEPKLRDVSTVFV